MTASPTSWWDAGDWPRVPVPRRSEPSAPTTPSVTLSRAPTPTFGGRRRPDRRYRPATVSRSGHCRSAAQTGLRVLSTKAGRLGPDALRCSSRLRDHDGRDLGCEHFWFSIAPLGDFDGDGDGRLCDRSTVVQRARWPGRRRVWSSWFHESEPAGCVEHASVGNCADPALNRSQLGNAVVGLGHFYAAPGTTLVVAAPGLGAPTSTSSNEGRIYAFHGRGPGAAIDVTAADHVFALVRPVCTDSSS